MAYDVRRFAELVKIEGVLHVIKADPDDDKFVECAVAGQANAIVSGDHHLLDLSEYRGIKVFSSFALFTQGTLLTDLRNGLNGNHCWRGGQSVQSALRIR